MAFLVDVPLARKAEIATVVTSVANLRLVDDKKYQQAELTGYYSEGDCPARVFYLDSADITTPENGFNVFASASGFRWKCKESQEKVIDGRCAGIVSDGVTDNKDAINAAGEIIKAWGGGELKLPYGVIATSGLHLFDYPIQISGIGSGNAAWTAFSQTIGTELKYIGAVTAFPFVEFRKINGGGSGVKNLKINGNGKAGGSFLLDSSCYGEFVNVYSAGATNDGTRLLGTYATCSWNTFKNCRFDGFGAGSALRLSGYFGQGNACHNTFIGTAINFGGSSQGLNLGGCDNNEFLMTYEFASPGATGYGVYVDPTEQSGFPINNSFYHLQASTRGWYQPATTVACPAAIYGYAQDNGQPWPVTNGTMLVVHGLDRGSIQIAPGSSFGRSVGTNFGGSAVIPNGQQVLTVVLPNGDEPDENYTVIPVFTNNPPNDTWAIRNRTDHQFEIVLNSPATSDLYFEFFIVRL